MAPSDIQQIISKLNRLNKNELIEIIVNRKVPDSLLDCPHLKYIFTKFCDKCGETSANNEIFADAVDSLAENGCQSYTCIRQKAELESKNSEFFTLNKLISQFEARVKDQEEIIKLLKICNNPKNGPIQQSFKPPPTGNNNTNKQLPPLPSLQIPTQSKSNNTQARDVSNKSNQNNIGQGPTIKNLFTNSQVKKGIDSAMTSININKNRHPNNNKNKPLIGTGQLADDSTRIKSIPKLGYLHAYRFHPETTTNDLQKHLSKSMPEVDFKCELWNKKEHSASFKIAFPIKDVDKVYASHIWPAGIAVRRFRFIRKNFQEFPQGQTAT